MPVGLYTGISFDLSVSFKHLLAKCAWHHAALSREQFEPVVFGRIMAGADLDPTGKTLRSHKHAGRRSGGNAGTGDLPGSTLAQSSSYRFHQCSAIGPAIACDEDWPSRK